MTKNSVVKATLGAVLIFGWIVTGVAADSIGQVTFLQGSVEIVRGDQTHTSDVDFGFSLENFDQITTGADGVAQLTLDPATGFDATITVQPDTTFNLDLGETDTGKSGALELMAGSVGLKVQKLSDAAQFEVRSSNAVMGIRGTEFDVATAVSGDLLVTVNEGRVECQDTAGETLFADSERAVENVVDGDFHTLPVAPGKTDDFRRTWMERRIAAFRNNAPQLLGRYAGRYALLRVRFDHAYESLLAKREILDRWFQEDRQRRLASRAQTLNERRQIESGLLQLRRIDYVFSRLYYRILALRRYYLTVSRWPDLPGFSAQEFFQRVENDRPQIIERLRTVRYVSKLFVNRQGALPLERLRDIEAAATR